MDLVEQVHISGFSNIHTFGPNIGLIRPFSLIFNYAKPRLMQLDQLTFIAVFLTFTTLITERFHGFCYNVDKGRCRGDEISTRFRYDLNSAFFGKVSI